MAVSIWRDKQITLTPYLVSGKADFSIYDGSTLIYSGTAAAAPDATCVVTINSICAQYLSERIVASGFGTSQVSWSSDSVKTFNVYSGSTLVESVAFSMDWSYDYDYNPNTTGRGNAPINRRIHLNQPVILSTYTSRTVTAKGSSYLLSAGGHVAVTGLTSEGSLVADSITYKAYGTCGKHYALYYVNAYGMWDTLAVWGAGKQTDSYKRTDFGKNYVNTTQANAGRQVLTTEVTRQWALKTGLLDDNGAANMHHLLGSPLVYLYDCDTHELQPVLITDSSCVYKTFRNQNGQPAQYTINVKLAKTLYR